QKIRVRLSDSVETALKWGEGRVLVLHQAPAPAEAEARGQSSAARAAEPRGRTGDSSEWSETLHSNRNYSPATGKSFETLTPKHFSFNSPAGACPVCHGLGQKMVFDDALVIPDVEKSLEQGAVLPWRRGGKRMITYYKSMLRGIAQHYGQSLETPYRELPDDFKKALLYGSGSTEIEFTFWRAGKMSKVNRAFEGVIPNLERLYQESE